MDICETDKPNAKHQVKMNEITLWKTNGRFFW